MTGSGYGPGGSDLFGLDFSLLAMKHRLGEDPMRGKDTRARLENPSSRSIFYSKVFDGPIN